MDETNEERPPASRLQQGALFEVTGTGRFRPGIAAPPPPVADSPLPVAAYWYRRHLESHGHTTNTVESYCYDLALFERQIGPKAIAAIAPRDIAHFLDGGLPRSTRKRRLTSLNGFFKYLIGSAKVLTVDPTENFYPEHIPLKTPRPLFAAEQERLLAAAAEDSSRAHLLIWLMLCLGLSRGEAINVREDHVDLSEPERPVVYVYYDNPRWAGKERHLAADSQFTALYHKFAGEYQPEGRLFPILPQSVNKIVERVAAAAGINREVTPQTLRDTYAVDQARAGADEAKLIALLGLADDPRNRLSVGRYLKLGAAPL
jgi:integrase/recombinase XerD